MKKILLFFFAVLFSASVFAQWTEYPSGFSTANRGINQIVATSATNAWATAFDASTAASVKIRDYTRTTDGGLTWTAGVVTAAPTTYNWSCFAAIDENTAWGMFYKSSTGSTGGIYKTTNGGQAWTQQGAGTIFSTAGASFPDVLYFWDANNGLAVGDPVNNEFEIYTTGDGGTTWTAVSGANIPDPVTGEYGLTRSFAARGNTFWFGTNAGNVYKTTDFGASWTELNTGSTNAIGSMEFSNDNDGWVELDDPTSFSFVSLYRTNDGGNTWNDITPAGTFFSSYNSVGICYVPTTDNVLVACGLDNASLTFGSAYSLDGGDTWVTIDSNVTHLAVKFYNNIVGYSGSVNLDADNFGVWKYDGGFVATGLSSLPTDYKFNLYPNPSNGLFYVSFDAENNLPINVQVTDALGKVVFQNTYKDKSQLWLRSIDLRNYSKGVYFLKLENNGNETMRTLVVQ